MPIRILSDTEKRKAKRGQTGGGRTSSWKRPYKDYTKIKHTNLIKTSTGKKGQIQEQSGAPGGEKKLHDKSMKRLNELQKLKSRSGTRMTSGAQKKRKEHLQSGGYKAGGDVAKRAKHGLGSLVKKGISKILKPKGVFKPKPVPKAVTDKPIGWSPKGEYTKADDKKITSILKKIGDEIKAAPLPPKLKATLKKAQKAFPHKKASGGRIGLKHGGSVGAAVRGHGAEIK